MGRPRALDLFGGSGGFAYGLMLAGFDVTVVDDVERPDRAPGVRWVTGDATTFPLDGYDVVTGGPPCTDHTTRRNIAERKRKTRAPAGTAWMLAHHLQRVQAWGAATGGLWVVENVEGARRKMPNPIKLCGTMFGIEDGGWSLRRHRYFSSNAFLMAPGPCRHQGKQFIHVYGDLTANDRACGGTARPGGDMRASVARARRLMGMPWAGADGLRLAVPVDYGRHIGEQLLAHLEVMGRA